MIVNRRTFNIKPDHLEEAVQALKDAVEATGPHLESNPLRILTAVFGPFDVLVAESVYESLEQYQQYWGELLKQPAMAKFFATWLTVIAGGGTNEIWEIR